MAKINLPEMWHILVDIITSFYFKDSRCDAVLAPVIAGGEPGRAAIARYDRWCQYIRKPVNVSVAAQQSPGGWSVHTHRWSFFTQPVNVIKPLFGGWNLYTHWWSFFTQPVNVIMPLLGGWSLITHSRSSFFTRPVNVLSRYANARTFLYCTSVVYKYLKFPSLLVN